MKKTAVLQLEQMSQANTELIREGAMAKISIMTNYRCQVNSVW